MQFFPNHEMLPTEVHRPHLDTGEAMMIAKKTGGAALEIAKVELLENPRWKQTMVAEALPTMFDL